MKVDSDILVIGGGLAGSALAIQLCASNRIVTLFEKQATAHDKVCGEFLSHEAIRYLALLGIDAGAIGAVPISAVRLAAKDVIAESRLPFPAQSLSRKRLDEALLNQASRAGVQILRGRRVEALSRTDSAHWQACLAGGEIFMGCEAFLATGKMDLRSWPRPRGRQNNLIAFKMHWQLSEEATRDLNRHVELILFRGGYCGLELVEDGFANLCLLVRRSEFKRLGGRWHNLLEHIQEDSRHLASRLAGARPLWDLPMALASIPYGYVRAESGGPWRLGDQSAVIPSFSGNGMSIALHSAALAASEYLSRGNDQTYQRRLRHAVRRRVALATTISQALVSSRTRWGIEAIARFAPTILADVASITRINDRDLC